MFDYSDKIEIEKFICVPDYILKKNIQQGIDKNNIREQGINNL